MSVGERACVSVFWRECEFLRVWVCEFFFHFVCVREFFFSILYVCVRVGMRT